MIDTYRDKQIDRFINNEMPPEERAVFIRELETDGELQQQVKLRGLLAEAEIREAENETAAILHTASGYLKQERAQDAIALLTPQILDSEYGEEAEWLLLCAYLYDNNREKAKVTAEAISRKDGLYATEAAAILKQLNEKYLF